MKLLRAIILLFLLVGVGFAQAPPFPPNPTVGQEVTGSDGQVYVWDGVKWARKVPGPWAPETKISLTPPANPTAGQLWYDPINLQTYIWYTDPTSSQWVAIVNGAGGGGGGGGGPFLPEDNPTYTGLMTGPSLLTTNTIGIGAAPVEYPLEITRNQNSDTAIALYNDSTTDNVASSLWLNNGPDWGGISLMGTGFVGPIPARSTYIYNTGPNGLRLVTDAGAISFVVPGGTAASIDSSGLTIPEINSASLWWGSRANPMASMMGYSAGSMYLMAGMHYTLPTGWVADKDTGATMSVGWSGAGTLFTANTGMTAGSAVTPFSVGYMGSNGLHLYNTGSNDMIYFDAAYGQAWNGISSGSPTDLNVHAGCILVGGVWIATAGFAETLNFGNDNAIGTYIGNGLTPGAGVGWARTSWFSPDALVLNTNPAGSYYHLNVNFGAINSVAQPWNGVDNLYAGGTQIWIPAQTCVPITPHSGILLATETTHNGVSCSFIMGGGGVRRIQTAPPDDRCFTGDFAPPVNRLTVNWGNNGWYYLCNGWLGPAIFGVVMLGSRPNP